MLIKKDFLADSQALVHSYSAINQAVNYLACKSALVQEELRMGRGRQAGGAQRGLREQGGLR